MRKFLLLLFLLPFYAFAGNNGPGWTVSKESNKRFIENKSQFDGRNNLANSTILFGVDQGPTQIFFTKDGLTFRFETKERKHKEEGENEREREREMKRMTAEEYLEHEKEEREMKITTDFVHMQWANANPNVEIIGEDLADDYFSYVKSNGENINFIKGYKKVVYKNLYPNIDVEYVFHPQDGIKYSLILHPGADASQVKMVYSDVNRIFADREGDMHFRTLFGDMVDHAPLTFYEADKNSVISSAFSKDGKEISFSLGNYDKTKTIVIDPWTQSPNFPATNWDCVWECERDGAGNVYVIGGTSPLQLKKYSPAGVIAWTYSTPYDTTEWLGTFATDIAGNSYVSQGSPARMHKVNAAGAMVWNNSSPATGLLNEFWSITFNCDQTKLIIGGTGPALPPTPYIYNMDMNTGSVTSSAKVAGGGGIGNDQETRAVAACGNSKYYFMSHDTIGYIHQNLTTCVTPGALPFRASSGANLSYKCENWRSTNSGIAAICWFNGFIFVNRGNQLEKRNFNTTAIISTANIPGGSYSGGFGGNNVGNSGIDIDACGNIYVGSTNGVHKFDQSLNLVGSYATTFNVYDVEVSTGGDIIAAGSTGNYNSASRTGSIQSFAVSACATQSLVCCDATICNAGPFCNPGPATTLTAGSSGGTWSGTGITNPTTGVFDPAVSGNGTFTITYTKACGSETIQIVVHPCSAPTVCLKSNGDLEVSGGSGGPYTWYQWMPASSTPITNQAQCTACNPSYTWFGQCLNGFTPVTTCNNPAGYQQFATGTTATPQGNWPIKVTDGAGNALILNSLAGIPPCSNMSTTSASTNIACNGQCTGTGTVTVTGGVAPVTYSWNTTPVQTTQVATGLCAGTYTVTVTDATPSTTTAMVTITQPAAMTLSVTANTAGCSASNGSASMTPSGGTSAYTYSWSNGQSTQTATGLAAGTYSATVTDANGCSANTTANVSNTGVPQASVTPTNVLCSGGSNGAATVTVTVGTAPFTYSWSPGGQTAATATGLSAGNYQVTVTDAGGCIVIVTATVTAPTALTATATATNANCAGSPGTGYVNAGGGTGSYTYAWSPGGQTAASATGLNAGTYSVTVTDANGCSNVQSVTVTQPPAFTTSVTVVGTNCGTSIGSASVSANGGTGTLSYSWSPGGQTAPSISNLAAGTYSCMITDANGCSQVIQAVVNNLNGPTATINGQVNNICNGGMIGTASANATGGSFPYTYTWNTSPPQTGANATGLGAGSYVVTVTDGTGCTNTQTVLITEPAAITTSVSVTQASCAQSDGTASVTPGGGAGPYTYLWNPTGDITASVSGLAAGTYSVLITDSNGCTQTATAVITNSNGPTALAGTTTAIMQGGTAQLSSSGGVSYLWSPGGSLNDSTIANPTASPSVTTTYCVYVTDSSGCTDSACVTIYVESPCTNTYYIPNAFSPNNDMENDVFKTYFPNVLCIQEYKLSVYDRWGEKIFETETPGAYWDGSFQYRAMDSEVLAYYVHILFMDGTLVDKRGNVSMMH